MEEVLGNIQSKISDFVDENNLHCSVEHRALDLVSEVGELAKEILIMADYGRKPMEKTENLRYEFGDTLFSLTALANELDVDLSEAINLTLEKYSKRISKNGFVGSHK